LSPGPRGEFSDAAGRMLVDPLQYVDEVGVGVDAMRPTGGQQRLDRGDLLGAELGGTESSQPRGVSPRGCSRNRT